MTLTELEKNGQDEKGNSTEVGLAEKILNISELLINNNIVVL